MKTGSSSWWYWTLIVVVSLGVTLGGVNPVFAVSNMPERIKEASPNLEHLRRLVNEGRSIDVVFLVDAHRDDLLAALPDHGALETILILSQGYLDNGMQPRAVDLLERCLAACSQVAAEKVLSVRLLLARAALQGEDLSLATRVLGAMESNVDLASQNEKFWYTVLKSQLLKKQSRSFQALGMAKQALEHASRLPGREANAYALVNLAGILADLHAVQDARKNYREALDLYLGLSSPVARTGGVIAAGLGLADLPSSSAESQPDSFDYVQESFAGARKMLGAQDGRLLSSLLGAWGELLAQHGETSAALEKTLQALHHAQLSHLDELIYKWQYRAGQLLKRQGRLEQSIGLLRASARNLNLLRKGVPLDCGIADGTFKQTILPIYQELIVALLERGDAVPEGEKQSYLRGAIESLELLRTEELRDYFEDACLGAERDERRQVGTPLSDTVALYTVTLPDRVDLIAVFPSGIRHIPLAVGPDKIRREVRLLRRALENYFSSWRRPAENLYGWLIAPLEEQLAREQVHTLVFVPDGALRTIPLAVLSDGNASLVDRFATATIQGMQITSGVSGETSALRAGLFFAGLSQAVQGYRPLKSVGDELKGIRDVYPGAALMDEAFQADRVAAQLEKTPYPILHFATHGEFTGKARDNYILTWDDKITLDDLDSIIRGEVARKQPIEILSLSACSTAAGDDRASLGLAGLAVKSGARTAVASLWDIDDQSTAEFFVSFYRALGRGEAGSRAEALRRAQLQVREKYPHPYHWAPFLLIGNWQ